jgi:hypothetical protein
MNGFSISNVNTLNTSNISTINISTGTITTSSLRGVNIVSSNATVSNILSGNNINGNNLYGSNSVSGTLVDAYNLNSRTFNLFDGPNDTFLNPIIGYNNQVLIQNQLLVSNYFTYTAGIINSNYLNNCNNDINFVSSLRFTNINGDIYTPLIQPLYGCNGYLVAGAQTHFLQGIDNCNNDINNVNTITVSNLVINTVVSVPPSLYPTLNPIIGSNDKLMIYNNIDMSNNSINNVFQTSNITDAATNIIIPFYFNMTNIAGANPVNINHNLGWQQVFTNQPTFSFSNNYFRIGGLAPLVKFNFNLRCRLYDNFHSDASNGAVAFCYTLSNQTLHVEISGNTFNSNYPIVSFPNFIDPNKYTLSYEDIFNINGSTTDTYCFNLYVYPSFQTLNPNYFLTDTHNITFQQVQQVTL